MLQNQTYFSLKYGLISPKELLEVSSKNGFENVLLADINNTSACLDFVRQASAFKVRPIIGVDFRNGNDPVYVAIAKNNDGFQEINEHLSEFTQAKKAFPLRAPQFKNVVIIYPWDKAPEDLEENEWIALKEEHLSHLPFSKWKNRQDKIVAFETATFRNKKDFNAHRLLRSIDTNALLSTLPKSEEGKAGDLFIAKSVLEKRFSSYPHLLENTEDLLSTCSIHFEFSSQENHSNLQTYTGSSEKDFILMKKLVYHGLSYRYKEVDDVILDRIDKELKVIKEKKFVTYFLIAWRMLQYARKKNYFYVGRGSGANSIVAYLMRITDVDPIELDLYFERFINLFRTSPPDFDIDFSWKERNDVTQFLFDRFDHVALLATYNTFQYKSTIRELGKVFGLPDFEIKKLQQEPGKADDIGRLILIYSEYIHGNPSHLSVHSAGIIISDKPIHYYTATNMPPKGFPITQFDMYISEDVGLYKFDILAQRGLAKVKDALEVIKYNQNGKEVDIHNIQKIKQDFASNDMLQKGNAIGCFYVESPAMRMLLMKLKVNNYLGLVAASSVIRPGVAQSGMMQQYILRFRDPAQRKKAREESPVLYDLMPETFGVMVYQEDVIKVAHCFADLTLAEADVLRRGMSGKFRSRDEFKVVENKFFENCKNKGYKETLVQDVWRQIESFAGYAFAKGHSASYAVESYQCLFLKAHYPLEYMVATVNNGGGFYSVELYLHEAKRNGATIHLPCVNKSSGQFIINGKDIYIGLARVQALESATIYRILEERNQGGDFIDFRDFVHRVAISLEQICLLIRVGGFSFVKCSKKELLWDAHLLLGKKVIPKINANLFESEVKEFSLPELWSHRLETAFDEMELLGFMVSISPFDIQKNSLGSKMCIRDFSNYLNQEIEIVGYLVHVKRTQTKSGERMYFGTFIDQEGDWVDTVHFPLIAERYPFRGPGCYRMKGIVTKEFDYLNLNVHWMQRLETLSLDD